MQGLSKIHLPDKTVLENITLAVLSRRQDRRARLQRRGQVERCCGSWPGSTRTSAARRRLAAGATVGLLEQEPQLDESKDVRGNVEEGVGEVKALVDRFNELAANYTDETADEFARLQEQIDAADALGPRHQLELAMDALRLPPGDADVEQALRRRAAAASRCAGCCCAKPDLLLLDEPTNHLDAESVAWLEQHLAEYPGTVVAVTHDRYFLDNVAGWILELDRGKGIPYEGNYSAWLEQKQKRLAQEEKRGVRPPDARSAASWSGCG